MARYILTNPLDKIKGSIGGATFQRCGRVLAIRKRNVPVQKRSPSQSVVKVAFEFVQKRWKNLSAADKATFAAQTINFTRIDSFGVSYELKSAMLQASTNLNMVSASSPVIDSMSTPVSCPIQTANTIAIVPAINAADIFADPIVIPANFTLSIFITAPLSVGIENPGIASMKLMRSFLSGQNSNTNTFTDYVAIWGDPSSKVGQQVWAAFVLTSTINGQSCAPFFDFGFIEP